MVTWAIRKDPLTMAPYLAVGEKGAALLVDPFVNKGTAFTEHERRALGVLGLLPPAVLTIEQQLRRTYGHFAAKTTPLDQHIYLTNLHDRNETLFYRLLHEHIEEMMPIIYTPVVGEACQKFSRIYRRPRGLYVSFDQRDRMETVLANAPCAAPRVIVVTDGERILGLGDQGVGGMGISIGKLSLYTLCAAVPPYATLPIMLDVGTDNPELLQDPLYLGLRHHRVRGEAYQDFIDRFVAAVQRQFPQVLLQWEDLLKGNAIKQLQRFRDQLCTFNDDIQGTAAVALAGIFSGLRITGQALRDQRAVFVGAGAAAQGIADLFVAALVEEGVPVGEARERVWTVDSRGLVLADRPQLDDFKTTYARDPAELAAYRCRDRTRMTLEEVIVHVRPMILLGTTGVPGTFTESVVRAMAAVQARPMIFPLSNPNSRAECTPADALRWSDGRAILATGSPFAPVTCGGRPHRIGQGNNAFIFPGVGLGVTAGHVRRVTEGMFYDAARTLAGLVTPADLDDGAIYPAITRSREIAHAVACAVIRRAVAEGHADPVALQHLEATVRLAMWFPDYLPIRYEA